MKTNPESRGAIALVLHTHMPYVEGFGTWPFGEEWLFEALATVYLPLTKMLEGLAEADRRQILTLSVTPVLADQLELQSVWKRFENFLTGVRSDTFDWDEKGLRDSGHPDLAETLAQMRGEYEEATDDISSCGTNLLARWKRLADNNVIELWASAATHAVLPLISDPALVQMQIASGIQAHRRRFGAWSGGFWLPECAYDESLLSDLDLYGVSAFCADQSRNPDKAGSLSPIATEIGALALPVEWPTVELVWSQAGYPANAVYRDYHCQTVHGLRPYSNDGSPYQRACAQNQIAKDAEDFLNRVGGLLDSYTSNGRRPGLVTCALDTELLGHWWYEGGGWLSKVIEFAPEYGIDLVSLPTGLDRFQAQNSPLIRSTWGKDKDLSTWDCAATREFVWLARQCEQKLIAALPSLGRQQCMAAACELVAMQSSDWAFMAEGGLAADYPQKRFAGHHEAFDASLTGGNCDNGYQGEEFNLAADLALTPLSAVSSATLPGG